MVLFHKMTTATIHSLFGSKFRFPKFSIEIGDARTRLLYRSRPPGLQAHSCLAHSQNFITALGNQSGYPHLLSTPIRTLPIPIVYLHFRPQRHKTTNLAKCHQLTKDQLCEEIVEWHRCSLHDIETTHVVLLQILHQPRTLVLRLWMNLQPHRIIEPSGNSDPASNVRFQKSRRAALS